MALKYKYNTKTLSYEKIERKFKDRILKTLAYATTGAIFASLFIALSYSVFDSPKEKDHVLVFGDVKVFIDLKSAIYLKGITALNLEIGAYEKWITLSDHMPLLISVDANSI